MTDRTELSLRVSPTPTNVGTAAVAADHSASPEPAAKNRRVTDWLPSYAAVLPMCLCEFLSFSILRAVVPRLQSQAFGRTSYAVEGATLAVQGVLSFLCCPMFGAISDRHGRRLPLAVCAVGMSLPSIVAIASGSLWHYQAFVALSGAFKGTFVVVFAYVADLVASGPRRTNAYGIVLGTLGLSFTVGPTIGGFFANRYGPNAAFGLCAALGLSAAAYALLILPESLPSAKMQAHRASGDLRNTSPLRVLSSVCADDYLSRLMLIAFLYYVSYWGLVPSATLYVTRRFGFTTTESGRLLGIVGGGNMTAEVVLVRLLLRAGFTEWTLLRIGLTGWALKCFCFAFATEPWLIYVGASLSLVTGLFGPSMTSIAATAGTSRGKQGEVQGAVSAFRALAEGAGPLISGSMLVRFEATSFPGAPYLAVGSLSLLALLMSYNVPPLDAAEPYIRTPDTTPAAVTQSDARVRRTAQSGAVDVGTPPSASSRGTAQLDNCSERLAVTP